MQESDRQKPTKRHETQSPKLASPQDVVRTESDVYGDEADVPRRKKNNKKHSAAQRRKKASNHAKKGSRPGWIRAFLGTGRPPIQVARSSDESHRFRGLMIYGHRIAMTPIIVFVVLIALASVIFMGGSNISVQDQQITIVGLNSALEGARILVLSDLNGRRFGDQQSALLRSINTLNYDAVFLLGDMVGKGGDPEPLFELLDGLPASKPVYFICGDADPGPFVSTPRDIRGTLSQIVLEDWILGAMERGAIYVDAPMKIAIGAGSMWISPANLLNMDAAELQSVWKEQMEQEEDGVLSGLEADYQTLPATSYRYRVAQNFYQAIGSMSDDDFLLCLAHEVPSDKTFSITEAHNSVDDKYLNTPELLIAGHYCGGVWRLPWIGAFYIPDDMIARNGWLPAQERVQGLSSRGVTQVYITGGLSTNAAVPAMPFRMLNSPQISILTLTATLPENMLEAE